MSQAEKLGDLLERVTRLEERVGWAAFELRRLSTKLREARPAPSSPVLADALHLIADRLDGDGPL